MTDLQQNVAAEEMTYCEVHPDRETSLRCNKCNRFMCPDCAVPTPVGYRCKECVRQHEDKFFSGTQSDYLVVFLTCTVLASLGAVIVDFVPFLLFVLFLSFPIGGAIGEAALRLTKRRRGRYSGYVGAAGVVLGGLASSAMQTLITLWPLLSSPEDLARAGISSGDVMNVIFRSMLDLNVLLFIGIAAFAVYGRFRMKI